MKTPIFALAVLALGGIAALAAETDQDFVVHEWGTFTSVQGADGEQMIWNPFVAPELPRFVYDAVHQHIGGRLHIAVAGKIQMATRQRMETPVIYFYSKKDRTVDVSVRFPEGKVTEWYPQESAADPRDPFMRQISSPFVQQIPGSHDAPILHWQNVRVLPSQSSEETRLLKDQSGSHYYAARETDSSRLVVSTDEPAGDPKVVDLSPRLFGLVTDHPELAALDWLSPAKSCDAFLKTVTTPSAASPTKSNTETEKFLFYRGVASFQAPLTVKLDPADSRQIVLTNTGTEELHHLFVYESGAGGGGDWVILKDLKPKETRTVALDQGLASLTVVDCSLSTAESPNSTQLKGALVEALIAEGLYRREAVAMVKTWEDTWFSEPGLRVLYTLPRSWTDRTLPLTITPSPKSIERVMIARAEVITPAMEQALLKQVERYIAAKPENRPQIVAETRKLELGRFTAPTMSRLLQNGNRDSEFSTRSWDLVREATAATVATTNNQ